VTFSTIPLIAVIQGLTIARATPFLAAERNVNAQCADHADRGFKTIDIVKAFNAIDREDDQLKYFLRHLTDAIRTQHLVWGTATGTSQFLVMSTFVTGFWYGAYLVRSGKNTPGEVMAVFWACLIASDNLQMVFPRLDLFHRGKEAMVSLLNLINTPLPPRDALPPPPDIIKDSTLRSPKLVPLKSKLKSKHASIKKIVPNVPCQGSINLRNVTFAYPARPLVAALNNVEMFFPAGEATYVVGQSGSGKSTVAALLTRLYTPQYGVIELDDQEMQHLDLGWTRSNIFHVSQNAILFSGSVAYNVAMGLAGSPFRTPADCSRAEVVAACKASALHEFISTLENGYDTIIGPGGVGLSGGQKQRLALARARVRDPTILILGTIVTPI
jgi:ATP-binding cassette, subfamily B (MDR/TAP), member 1